MTAPIEAQPLARLIARHAYRAGAGVVTTIYLGSAQATLERFRKRP